MSDLNAMLRGSGLAVFEDRVIHDARPPITNEELGSVAARCRGPLPQGLIDLWRTAFGGRLDYELFAPLGDAWTWLSIAELFYPGSEGYRDLWGWIEHELDLAAEAMAARGETFDGHLDYLPFGGFEYLERLYVCTVPGSDHGKVVVWVQGLPPAWGGKLHGGATVIPLADNIPALFRKFSFDTDPFTAEDETADSGLELVEAIDAIEDRDPKAHAALKALVAAVIRPRPEPLVRN